MRLAPSRTRERAELERERGRGGEELSVLFSAHLSICLSVHPCYTVSERGECLQTERQTDGQTDREGHVLSSSPPPSSHIWLRVLFGLLRSFLGFLVCVYFWYPLMIKKCDACSPHYSVSLQKYPHSRGFGVKEQFPK